MSAGAELAAGGREATVLRGEAGIGKTTLLAEAQRLAAHCGLQVLTCRRVRAEANLPVPVVADDAHWALKAPGPAGQEQRSARQERGRGGRGP
jgi:hypothetical protein